MKREHGLYYGVGIMDADYKTRLFEVVDGKRKCTWTCPYYRRWEAMIRRCYSNNDHAYTDCSVNKDWLLFSNFKRWMECQNWEGRELDKDLLFVGNKEYGPSVCTFVPHIVNSFTTDRRNARGEQPIGVYFKKKINKFVAQCCNPFTKKQERLGYFDCPDQAHLAWKKRKHELACQLADSEHVTDDRVADALRNRYK